VPLSLEQKKAVVAEVAQVATRAHSAVAAEYRGLSVASMTELRARARHAGVYLRVVRNTLARRAFAETAYACMSDHLSGPLVLAFSEHEPGAAARLLSEFAKKNDKLIIRLASIDGRILEGVDVGRLAALPTRDEAISRLMATMLAPLGKLVRTLPEPHAKLVRTIAAVRDQKQAA